MQGTDAIVVTKHDLKQMLTEAGTVAAEKVLNSFKDELNVDPLEKQAKRLKDFIEDRTTIENPRGEWASGRHIRLIAPNKNGKPKSMAWFQTFKKESILNQCPDRSSTDHGRLREWCFEDIANAWDYYHRQRWLRG